MRAPGLRVRLDDIEKAPVEKRVCIAPHRAASRH
jgi:hypothetical protein